MPIISSKISFIDWFIIIFFLVVVVGWIGAMLFEVLALQLVVSLNHLVTIVFSLGFLLTCSVQTYAQWALTLPKIEGIWDSCPRNCLMGILVWLLESPWSMGWDSIRHLIWIWGDQIFVYYDKDGRATFMSLNVYLGLSFNQEIRRKGGWQNALSWSRLKQTQTFSPPPIAPGVI